MACSHGLDVPSCFECFGAHLRTTSDTSSRSSKPTHIQKVAMAGYVIPLADLPISALLHIPQVLPEPIPIGKLHEVFPIIADTPYGQAPVLFWVGRISPLSLTAQEIAPSGTSEQLEAVQDLRASETPRFVSQPPTVVDVTDLFRAWESAQEFQIPESELDPDPSEAVTDPDITIHGLSIDTDPYDPADET